MHKKINVFFVLSFLFTTAQHCAESVVNPEATVSSAAIDATSNTEISENQSILDSIAAIKDLARTNNALTKRNFYLENKNQELIKTIQELPQRIEQERQERIEQYAPEQHRRQPALRTPTTASSDATVENATEEEQRRLTQTNTTLNRRRHIQIAPQTQETALSTKKSSWISKLLWFTTGAATTLVVYHNKERIKDFTSHHSAPIKDFIANRTTGCSTAMLDIISGKHD
ncbi:hypothetical protein KBD08_00085 [Candidatus Babeliales bacterium]|nr:hypothetical protein [Candidatus Babeliales bacterium]